MATRKMSGIYVTHIPAHSRKVSRDPRLWELYRLWEVDAMARHGQIDLTNAEQCREWLSTGFDAWHANADWKGSFEE